MQGDFFLLKTKCACKVSFTRNMGNAFFRHSCRRTQGHIKDLVANQCIIVLLTLPLSGLIVLLKSTMCKWNVLGFKSESVCI